MAKWAPERRAVMDELVEEVCHNWPKGRVMVAVDGPLAARNAAFADEFAAAFRRAGHETFRASTVDFLAPLAAREPRGSEALAGRSPDALDVQTLRRVLVGPFRLGGSAGFVTAAFDAERDQRVEPRWSTAGPDAVLVIDGLFLHRQELRASWNFSVWLKEAVDPRELPAGDTALDAEAEAAERAYRRESDPVHHASAIVDDTDPEHPRRSFADAC